MTILQRLGRRNGDWLCHIPDEILRHHIYRAHNQFVKGGVYEPFLKHPAWTAAGFSLLVTAGTVGIHVDAEELPRFSYHAVLLNDGFVAKQPWQPAGLSNRQPAGSIIQLDIHEKHHLVRDSGLVRDLCDYPGWASLVFNTDEPLGLNDIIARFRRVCDIKQEHYQ